MPDLVNKVVTIRSDVFAACLSVEWHSAAVFAVFYFLSHSIKALMKVDCQNHFGRCQKTPPKQKVKRKKKKESDNNEGWDKCV